MESKRRARRFSNWLAMTKNNGYLARQALRDRKIQQATRQTHEQYMTDILMMTLNDPEVMGKDVFGYSRIKKLLIAIGEKYDTYFSALTKGDEADYFRAKIDEAIKRICGDDFVRFEERYDGCLKSPMIKNEPAGGCNPGRRRERKER